MSFNLASEPWIQVVIGPTRQLWSLRDVLVRAHEVTRLDPGGALERAALFRFLQAVIIDLQRDEHETTWARRFHAGQFPASVIDDYLQTVGSRLDLLHPEHPFYQVAGLEAVSGQIKSPLLLLPEVATGNNVPLFSSVLESDKPELTLPQAAVRLIACHAWDVAGLKTGAVGDAKVSGGKTTGNPVAALGQVGYIAPQGRNLFESLMLNLPVRRPAEEDLPTWRQPPHDASWETRPSLGVLDLLTWQSRRIRLVFHQGNVTPAVTGVVIAAGDRLTGINPDQEPHTAWRAIESAGGGMANRPVRHQPGRAAWRGMDALLGNRSDLSMPNALSWCLARENILGRDYVIDTQIMGVVYGNQSAVVEHVVSDSVPLVVLALDSADGALVREVLARLVAEAEAVRLALNKLDDNLRRARGGEPIPWDKGERPGERYIALLDGPTRWFLSELPGSLNDPIVAIEGWERNALDSAWSIANPLIDRVSTTAFAGRQVKKSHINQASAEGYFRHALKETFPEIYSALREEVADV